MKINKSKCKGYVLIRDKNGNPKIDDIYNIPKKMWELLTTEEQKQI
jgi:hypothetical protein